MSAHTIHSDTPLLGCESLTTPEGQAHWIQNTALQNIVTAFINEGENSDTLRALDFVGEGRNSKVYAIDDIALKVATSDTGSSTYESGRGISPENLCGQFRFLTAVQEHLGASADIIVPRQYFAIKVPNGTYLRAEQLLSGWQTLESAARASSNTDISTAEIYKAAKQRILRALGKTQLLHGLNDLGLGPRQKLVAANVLTPGAINAIDKQPLCIIDQPSRGMLGEIALWRAGIRAQKTGLQNLNK